MAKLQTRSLPRPAALCLFMAATVCRALGTGSRVMNGPTGSLTDEEWDSIWTKPNATGSATVKLPDFRGAWSPDAKIDVKMTIAVRDMPIGAHPGTFTVGTAIGSNVSDSAVRRKNGSIEVDDAWMGCANYYSGFDAHWANNADESGTDCTGLLSADCISDLTQGSLKSVQNPSNLFPNGSFHNCFAGSPPQSCKVLWSQYSGFGVGLTPPRMNGSADMNIAIESHAQGDNQLYDDRVRAGWAILTTWVYNNISRAIEAGNKTAVVPIVTLTCLKTQRVADGSRVSSAGSVSYAANLGWLVAALVAGIVLI